MLTEHLAATQSAEAKVLQTVWNKPTHNLGLGEGECALGESCSFYWFRLDLACARARALVCLCAFRQPAGQSNGSALWLFVSRFGNM